MNPSFHFRSTFTSTASADLYLVINGQELSFFILDGEVCLALVIYHFKKDVSDEISAGYIHEVVSEQTVLQQKFNNTHIIYGYRSSILVPQQFMNEADNTAMLDLVYGDASEKVTRSDFMYRHSLHNVYGIPVVIEQAIARYFGVAGITHLFSLLPEFVKGADDHLFCIFSTGQLKVLLADEGKLQIMQNYTYITPEDVVYHLLNLCKSFDSDVSSLTIHVSGMIDEQSPLYIELRKYFLRLQFEALPEQYQYPEEIFKYPAHYFSHLFLIASCV